LIGLAPAKLNLALRVLGRRHDGYHEVATLMAPIDLFDVVRVRLHAERCCLCPGVEGENLALRAADLLGTSARIEIDKRIPIAAGLGGGSSDAACVLRLLSAPDRNVASHLGADVPFFLLGGPAWATGVGADLEPIEDLPAVNAVLVVPPAPLETSAMYAALGRGEFAGAAPPRPPLKRSLDRLCAEVVNDFLPAAAKRVPAVAAAMAALSTAGALVTSISGKGPACFGVFARQELAVAAAARLRGELPQEFLVVAAQTLPPPGALWSALSGSHPRLTDGGLSSI